MSGDLFSLILAITLNRTVVSGLRLFLIIYFPSQARFNIYSRIPLARTALGSWEFVLDMSSSSH